MKLPSKISIDSCKLRIPVNFVQIIDKNLLDKYILVNERELNEGSLEIDPYYFKQNSLWFEHKGIKIKFALQHLTDSNLQSKEYLVILVTSKLLGSKYFHGINKDTIKLLYQNLMACNIVKFDFDHFINFTYLSDCDFKRDFLVKDHDSIYSAIVKDIDENKRSALALHGYRRFNKTTNKGIEFGDRKRADHKTPFYKIYSKKIELLSNSPEFYEWQQKAFDKIFIKSIPFSDIATKKEMSKEFDYSNLLMRAEFTLKNRKAFKYFLKCENSLKEVLNLKQSTLIKALQQIKGIHITDRFKRREVKGYTPTEIVILNLLNIWNELEYKHSKNKDRSPDLPNIDFTDVEQYVLQSLNGQENKNAKNRMKKKLEKIYYDAIYTHTDSTIYKENQRYIAEGLRMIGYII